MVQVLLTKFLKDKSEIGLWKDKTGLETTKSKYNRFYEGQTRVEKL